MNKQEIIDKVSSKYRIREVNGKFYPERLIGHTFWGGKEMWSREWPSKFINGDWLGGSFVYDFRSLEEAQEFIASRIVKLHKYEQPG
jgi:hypothetical protein